MATALAWGCGQTTFPSGGCRLARPPISKHLRADGVHLRDAQGRIVLLRGVNAGGRSKFAPYVPFDVAPGQTFEAALAAYLDRAVSWGIDVLRVPFTWEAVEPAEGQDDAAYLAKYDAILDGAWARGIYTIVEFHQDIYSETYCGDGFPDWTLPNPGPAHHDCPTWHLKYLGDPQVAAAYDRLWAKESPIRTKLLAMWDRMAERHKNRPGVIGFEVFNEPGWGTGDAQSFERTALSKFYADLVPRLRRAAPEVLVFFEPVVVSSFTLVTRLDRPRGDGIVFAPHFYPPTDRLEAVPVGLQKWVDVGAEWNVPTFVGEFGTNHDSPAAKDYMSAHFAALDALLIGGSEWHYSVAQDDWNQEGFSIVGRDGREYPVADAIIRPFARAIAGEKISTRFDPGTRQFDLHFTANPGAISEVSLPARAYPAGFSVHLGGGCYDDSQAGRVLIGANAGEVDLQITPR